MILRNKARRSAATAVEMAFVAPVFVFLIFALVVGGLGMFRYNQVAHLARHAARYAAVRGYDYHQENNVPAATQQTIRDEAVLPNAFGLDPNLLTVQVTWDRSNATRELRPDETVRNNYVIVTVSYQWLPELLVSGGVMSSTSKMPMSY